MVLTSCLKLLLGSGELMEDMGGAVMTAMCEDGADKSSSPRPSTSLTGSHSTHSSASSRRKKGVYAQVPDIFTMSYDEEDQSDGLATSTHSVASSAGGSTHGGQMSEKKKYFEMANTMTRTRDRRSRSNSTEQREPLVVYNIINNAADN